MDEKFSIFQSALLAYGQELENIEENRNKNDIYFGPFANVNVVDQVLQQLERAFY